MAISQKLHTKLVQKLILTPSLQQAIKLLPMSTLELWRYIGHLGENEQAAQLQKIQFWNRALYPVVCLVMVGLALAAALDSSGVSAIVVDPADPARVFIRNVGVVDQDVHVQAERMAHHDRRA